VVMQCPECGAENPDGAQYCSLCLTSLGFESAEFPTVEAHEAGSTPPPRSGSADVETSREITSSGAAMPSDYRSPGDWSGARPWGHEEEMRDGRATAFGWGTGVLRCIYASIVAGAATLGLEFILGLIVLDTILSGSIDVSYTWIFVVLLIPVCICTVYVGYRSRIYGWALGMITVAFWAIVTKPIFNFVFLWIMDASHKASPFVGARIALDLGVALPLGAILGWLGEKRAIARITKKRFSHNKVS